MNILGQIGAVGSALRGASELVRELKRPKMSAETFDHLLLQQMEASKKTDKANAAENAQQLSERFLQTFDVNGDGGLSLEESGLAAVQFGRLDQNQDGLVTARELQAMHQLKPTLGK
jgi:hypothetical protein